MDTGDLLSFGPYLLDRQARRLTRDGADVRMASRHVDLLCLLVSHAGQVVPKETLIAGVWHDVAVTTGSLDQGLFALRQTLPMPSGQPLIETQARRGVRFVAPVSRVERRASDDALDAILETHRAWTEGRAALETLERGAIVRARTAFERVVEQMPALATAHVGLANACALQFETTRTDAKPDVAALEKALAHALEARRRNPTYGEAWATLGFVLERVGRRDDALAAARHSIVLEPDNWRHHLRLSAASWGEERLREARRTLHRLPGLPMAHWLAASVLIARGLLTEAEEELRIGLTHPSSPFGCVALHWLLGLLLLTRGARSDAMDAFHRELDEEQSGHLYATEVAANTWYAIGAAHLAAGDRTGARDAFLECTRRVPTHLLARAALGSAGLGSAGLGSARLGTAPPAAGPSAMDRAIAQAISLASHDDRAESHGAPVVERALAEAPAGNAGWLLPVEPMLAIASCPAPWLSVLARLRSRAA